MSQWFFTSDLHGQSDLYEQVLLHAREHRPRAVILGGDLGPHGTGAPGVRYQRLFLEGFLVEFARRLRDAVPESELLLLMGNDDWRANVDVLETWHGRLWQHIHERVATVDGTPVAGLAWVPITPFRIKDWERWEDGEPETPGRLDGFVSEGDGVREHQFDPEHRAPTIASALRALSEAAGARRTVYVTHSPPQATRCDCTLGRQHVGSRALREFIAHARPPLVLSGHIHESPRVTGAWRDRIGESLVVNPGQFGTPRLCGVWFDPEDPAGTIRHTVHPA